MGSVKNLFSTHRVRAFQSLFALALLTLTNSAVTASETSTSATTNSAKKDSINITHAVAMHGSPKYPENFKKFDYVSEKAIKGGSVKLGAIGTFDSFNPFIAKGTPADDIGLIYDSLTSPSRDEAFSHYGLIAEKIEMPEDRSWVIFHLRQSARFHDGHPITAEDIVFSFNILKEKGNPFYKAYYSGVSEVSALEKHKVKYTFKDASNRELALIVGELPVLPKHYWQDKDFSKSSLDKPLGSGPYFVKSLDPGRTVTLERAKDYWAKDLPINIGRYNYDTIQYDYYRDSTVALEAFKAGEFDFRSENSSKFWATSYTGNAIDKGLINTLNQSHQNSTGMQGYIFNTRRSFFSDKKVRQALTLAFDFEWANKSLFYDAYTRTESYFSNSELASSGIPEGRELEILNTFKNQLPKEIFTTAFSLPKTDASGRPRKNLRAAKKLLDEAGWKIKDRKLIDPGTQKPLTFEILLVSPAFERITNPYIKNLERLGVTVSVRTIDVSQYIQRTRDFDFDMIVSSFGQSLSPGNEQRSYWHSDMADVNSSRNIIGIKDPVVDQLVDLVINAPSREELIVRTRALDRVLLQGYYVVPQWHIRNHRIAYWKMFDSPTTPPLYGNAFDSFFTWWIDPEKQKKLNLAKTQ